MKIPVTRWAAAAAGLLLAGCAALWAPRPLPAPADGMLDATRVLQELVEFQRQCRIVHGTRCHGGGAGPVVKIEGVGPGQVADAQAALRLLDSRMQCMQRCFEREAAGELRTANDRTQCLRSCQLAVVPQ